MSAPVTDVQLRHIAHRAHVEAQAGAPGRMVAHYVATEVEHLLADHTGNAQDCTPCNLAAAAFRDNLNPFREE